LTDVLAVAEDGMVPVFEAEEAMRLRMASLRLASGSASVATSSKQGFGFSVPDGGCADVFRRPSTNPGTVLPTCQV
jgi:hypothetical protein